MTMARTIDAFDQDNRNDQHKRAVDRKDHFSVVVLLLDESLQKKKEEKMVF
jgi:hypothetical protein